MSIIVRERKLRCPIALLRPVVGAIPKMKTEGQKDTGRSLPRPRNQELTLGADALMREASYLAHTWPYSGARILFSWRSSNCH
jgi:hypothetical protein